MRDQRNHQQRQEDKEQDLRDPGRCRSDTAKTQNTGNDGDDKKNQSPTKHGTLLNVASLTNAAPPLWFHHPEGGTSCPFLR